MNSDVSKAGMHLLLCAAVEERVSRLSSKPCERESLRPPRVPIPPVERVRSGTSGANSSLQMIHAGGVSDIDWHSSQLYDLSWLDPYSRVPLVPFGDYGRMTICT